MKREINLNETKYTKKVENENGIIGLYKVGTDDVGVVEFDTSKYDSNDAILLKNFAVNPEYSGSEVLELVCNDIMKLGYNIIECIVNKENNKMLSALLRNNFYIISIDNDNILLSKSKFKSNNDEMVDKLLFDKLKEKLS